MGIARVLGKGPSRYIKAYRRNSPGIASGATHERCQAHLQEPDVNLTTIQGLVFQAANLPPASEFSWRLLSGFGVMKSPWPGSEPSARGKIAACWFGSGR